MSRSVAAPLEQKTVPVVPVFAHYTTYRDLPFVMVNYKIEPSWSVYAQYAEGIYVPDISSFEQAKPTTTYPKAQTTTNYQVGTVFYADQFTFDADLYYIGIANNITYQACNIAPFTGSASETCALNTGIATYRGMEGEGTYAFDGDLEGLSVFLVDMRSALGKGLTIRPIRTMMNHATTEVFFDNMKVPAEGLIGEEGKGFRYILSGMNAERILIASECIGDAKWFIEKATAYAKERVLFGRPIGQNQGVQFPIADAFIELEAANLMRWKACEKIDAHQNAGAEANMAKYLAAKASWEAANVCLQTHGGFGFACEYDIERKFRETRLYQVAPISTNLVLSFIGEHVLGMPRSF